MFFFFANICGFDLVIKEEKRFPGLLVSLLLCKRYVSLKKYTQRLFIFPSLK